MNEDFSLTTKDVMEILGVSRRTVYRYKKSGKLKCKVNKLNNKLYFDRFEVERVGKLYEV